MRVGCGLEVRTVNGRRYLYLWRYIRTAGGLRRSWKYIGPVSDGETRRKALVELHASYAAAMAEMERRLRIIGARLSRLR